MLQIPSSPVPCISISLAPHELPIEEPKSPFVISLPVEEEPDTPKSQHLLPPPVLSPHQLLRIERQGQLSPLSSGGSGKGLERQKFEAMLKASRERSALVGAKKPVELRKELAVKVQMAKQLQRRAKFLNKLAEPPSPSATEQPVTPPESPAVFHFSLPSPGLESPLEVFENLDYEPRRAERIEQVDFRLPSQRMAEEARRTRREVQRGRLTVPLPSLEQISQRLSKNPASVRIERSPSPDEASQRTNRLPSFLRGRSASPELVDDKKPKLSLVVARNFTRLMETREPTPIVPKEMTAFPPSPKSPQPPKLQITTVLCPPTKSKSSPTEFTEANVTHFAATHATSAMQSRVTVKAPVKAPVPAPASIPARRAEVTKDMFNKLSRRTPCLAGAAACGIKAKDDIVLASPTSEGGLKRRTSAPAELPASQRKPRHPVLDKPGGF